MATQTMPLSSAQIDFVRDVATTLALNPADEWAEMVFRGVATLTYECRDQSSAESGPKQPATTGLSRDSRDHGAGMRRLSEQRKDIGSGFSFDARMQVGQDLHPFVLGSWSNSILVTPFKPQHHRLLRALVVVPLSFLLDGSALRGARRRAY